MNVLENDLSQFNKNEILAGLTYLVKTERKVTFHLLRFINEVASRRIYLDEGFDSLLRYLVERHKYSERSALRRINAAKVLRQQPQVSEKIQNGEIKLSQLERVHQCSLQKTKAGESMDSAFTAQILSQVQNMTTFETEQLLATELDFKPKLIQKLTPQSDGSVILQCSLSAEQYAELKKAQSYISHAVPSNDFAEAISYLARVQIKKIEGNISAVRKSLESEDISSVGATVLDAVAKSAQYMAGDSQADSVLAADEQCECTGTHQAEKSQLAVDCSPSFTPCAGASPKSGRKYIRRSLRRRLLQKAGGECEFVHHSTGEKCCSMFQLQVDHVVPLALGGQDHESNMRILCGAHNRYEAVRSGLHPPAEKGMKATFQESF